MAFKALGAEGLARNWLGDQSTALPAVMGVMIWFQIGYPVVVFMAACSGSNRSSTKPPRSMAHRRGSDFATSRCP
jgi:ABC-type sugar transport system permease subunit